LIPIFRYAIGGLAGGEDKDSFWKAVAHVRSYASQMTVIFQVCEVLIIFVMFYFSLFIYF
jgi:queuine/archaeosine tRNA-ribosyltransferase